MRDTRIRIIPSPPDMDEALDQMQSDIDRAVKRRNEDRHLELWAIEPTYDPPIPMLSVINAQLHIDEQFPEWTAIWIAHASGHELIVQDKFRKPISVNRVLLTRGMIAVFNSMTPHRTKGGKGPLLFASVECKQEPSDDLVLASLREKCRMLKETIDV